MENLAIVIRKIGDFFAGPIVAILLAVGIGFLFYNLYSVSSTYHQETSDTSAAADKEQIFKANNKIVQYLPYTSSYYSISYDKNGSDPVTINIYAGFPLDRNDALQYLISKDPEVTINHQINFPDFKSPLIKKEGV